MGVHSRACTRIYTVCIWSRHLKLYWRKWSLIQMSLMKHSLYNLNWSFSEHTVACANIIMLCCVTAVCLCKKKLLRNQSWVNLLFSVLQDLILDSILDSFFSILNSWFSIRAGIENHELCQESRLATDCQLTFEQYCNCLNGWFTDEIMVINE